MNWEKVEKDVTTGPFGAFKWVAIAIVAFTLLFSGLSMVMKPAHVAVDRVVMKNSFQYQEGMEQRAAILQANIQEIDVRIQQHPEQRKALQAQRRILSAQLQAITINQ